MYTALHVSKYPLFHLKTTGWYLDFSAGFVSLVEKALYTSLNDRVLVEIIDLEDKLKEPKS